MKGDFSLLGFDPESQYTGVRHQQGRVLLDRDWNDAQEIEASWRNAVFWARPATSFTRPVSTKRVRNSFPSTPRCQP